MGVANYHLIVKIDIFFHHILVSIDKINKSADYITCQAFIS